MSNSIPAQHPAVVLRSQYRQLRSLLAVLIVAVVGLSTTVVVLAGNDSETTTTSSVSRSYPTLNDPFQSQVEQPRTQSRPDESAVATAISPQTSVSAPDESKIAAAIAEHADTGPQARARAWQEKLDSMTPQQQAEAFVKGH